MIPQPSVKRYIIKTSFLRPTKDVMQCQIRTVEEDEMLGSLQSVLYHRGHQYQKIAVSDASVEDRRIGLLTKKELAKKHSLIETPSWTDHP